ncbi:formate--tetrahydrofolate ligase [candidate division WOR-3 bacterium]|uniref:Formate--tetrahydrofolate ligase n=1 Tax=candidate division TA06 bacterium TaxID=2250710 RepID=A0A660SAA9_UNCT6|nr:formate--tetrahydrofolate ligase [candidate division WOR-3 bacterium]RKX66304.1 MAG: formate--tetrahydrofolate ligase [candidate division TA06 bacterium]
MKSDVEIAESTRLLPITEIAGNLGISNDTIYQCGKYKAKIPLSFINSLKDNKEGKVVVVTAMTPTKFGEGKTMISIATSMALNKMGKSSVVTLREPSLGPVFGIKGGAAGGGYSQVLPMEDINLHFTGDIHAITTANNLISAVLDNHLHNGNDLNLDTRNIYWKRAMDMNERALRHVVVGLGGRSNGYPREEGFIISAASEIMAILSLSKSISEVKERTDKILLGFTTDKKPVLARDMHISGAIATILKDALMPNLVQTIEHTPAIIHTGPFANIAHGTNSILATYMANKLSDYTVVETGFGSDLGFEKFVDLVTRYHNFPINAAVLVVTVRAMKFHGNDDIKTGFENVKHHINNIRNFGIKPVVAVNVFDNDTKEELELVKSLLNDIDVDFAFSTAHKDGSKGAMELASVVAKVADDSDGKFKRHYTNEMSIPEKIESVAKNVYGAAGVIYARHVKRTLARLQDMEFCKLPICIAKTQMSISDNPNKKGKPEPFMLNINKINISSGAGFIVPIAGEIMLMPGLPKKPSAEIIDIDDNGKISGLF